MGFEPTLKQRNGLNTKVRENEWQRWDSNPHGTGFVEVSSSLHSVALKTDGSLVSWGNDLFRQVSDTPTGKDFVSVSATGYHSVALKTDGSLVSWGNDLFGQVSNTPTGNDFAQMAGGKSFSAAVRTDGSLVVWGADSSGQISNTPPGKDFAQIAAGTEHVLALRTDGSVVGWGDDSFGQASLVPPGISFGQISGGMFFSLGIEGSGASPHLAVTNLVSGSVAKVTIDYASPNNIVYFVWSASGGGPINTPFGAGYVSQPIHIIPLSTDLSGHAELNQNVPAGLAGANVWFHGADYGSATMLNNIAATIG